MKFSTMDGIRQNLDDWRKVGKVDSEMLFDQLPMEELGADGMDDLLLSAALLLSNFEEN